jgi:NADH-quinone oxidoreductase subunit I
MFEIVKGLAITFKHMGKKATTLQYPEEKKVMPERFRGRHHLRRDKEGLELCIGCHLCAVVCPADAIFLEAEENTVENPHSGGERYAKIYQIDYLRCIFCGFCVDACPTDALVMGKEYEMGAFKREDFIYKKEKLMDPPQEKTAVEAYYKANGGTWNSDKNELEKGDVKE